MRTEVATNTNLTVFNLEKRMRTMTELIPIYARHGIRHLDLNFCEMLNPESILNGEKANEYLEKLMELKDELGLCFIQSHAPYHVKGIERHLVDERIEKAVEYSFRLGVSHVVVHPVAKSIAENRDYFSRLLEKTGYKIPLALENMETDKEVSYANEVLEIAEPFGPLMGVCFDIGHAHVLGLDIPKEIETYASHLIGTHIHDNDGQGDQHLFPFNGSIDWANAMRAFKNHYDGFINFEAMFQSRSTSIARTDQLIDEAIARHKRLISLVE